MFLLARCLTPDCGRGKGTKDHLTASLSDEDIDAGFAFPSDPSNRPLSTRPFDLLVWTTKVLSPQNKSSPVAGWSARLVKEAMRLLATEGSLARVRFHYGLVFPVHFQSWLVDIIEQVWDPDTKAITFLGEPEA